MPTAVGLGGRLFAARSLVPAPFLLAAILLASGPRGLLAPGLLLVAAGEALRLWGVAWIGPRSRTRGPDVGDLATGGPYRWSRNPLYLANLSMWAGVGLLTGRAWMAPAMVAPLALHYALVVRWEEQNLRVRLGSRYTAWSIGVSRWLGWPVSPGEGEPDWRAAVRSERSTGLALSFVVAAVLGAGMLRSA